MNKVAGLAKAVGLDDELESLKDIVGLGGARHEVKEAYATTADARDVSDEANDAGAKSLDQESDEADKK
jgi:hypothetical protein